MPLDWLALVRLQAETVMAGQLLVSIEAGQLSNCGAALGGSSSSGIHSNNSFPPGAKLPQSKA